MPFASTFVHRHPCSRVEKRLVRRLGEAWCQVWRNAKTTFERERRVALHLQSGVATHAHFGSVWSRWPPSSQEDPWLFAFLSGVYSIGMECALVLQNMKKIRILIIPYHYLPLVFGIIHTPHGRQRPADQTQPTKCRHKLRHQKTTTKHVAQSSILLTFFSRCVRRVWIHSPPPWNQPSSLDPVGRNASHPVLISRAAPNSLKCERVFRDTAGPDTLDQDFAYVCTKHMFMYLP